MLVCIKLFINLTVFFDRLGLFYLNKSSAIIRFSLSSDSFKELAND
ncbi:hypothetical protein EV197_1371 [Aquimarina brevivitae]|uniref:Uncharacterized protein n=1 Tax=Aquimarina brevivitae TaxID=323412 RepID=A0A4Q7PIP0_9FLAO|nr:hypothetical protein EV197_1371 [Aquimarina brevivitae]